MIFLVATLDLQIVRRPKKFQHQRYDTTAILLRVGRRGRRPLQFYLQQILSNGRTLCLSITLVSYAHSSFLIPHSSLISLFQIFYFFKMNIFSAARNNSNSRKRHILNRKDLCYEKIIRYAYLPQPLRYHARRLFKK